MGLSELYMHSRLWNSIWSCVGLLKIFVHLSNTIYAIHFYIIDEWSRVVGFNFHAKRIIPCTLSWTGRAVSISKEVLCWKENSATLSCKSVFSSSILFTLPICWETLSQTLVMTVFSWVVSSYLFIYPITWPCQDFQQVPMTISLLSWTTQIKIKV